jgi:hypothetical protein
VATLQERGGDLLGAIDTSMRYLKTQSLVTIGEQILSIIKDAQRRELIRRRKPASIDESLKENTFPILQRKYG